MTFKLAQIKPEQKEYVLKEYFNLCKMVYRINSIVAYNWNQGAASYDLIFRLYNQDETFAKMIEIAKNSIFQVFKGTNPR